MLLFINGWYLIWNVDKNVDWFDLIGLDLEMNYNLLFIMEYGSQMSDLVVLQFCIIVFFVVFIGGVIVGISIGNIYIVIIYFLGFNLILYICLKFCIFIF